MTIYVKSVTSHGKCAIVDFRDKNDLRAYARELASQRDIWIKSSMNIDDILHELFDVHIVTVLGSVFHCRISRKDAIQAIRDGAKNATFLDVKRRDI